MTGKSPEEMVREAVVDQLMRLATAVRADHVTGIEFTWKEGEYPNCALKLRAPANQIVLETTTDLALGLGEKGSD